VEGAIGMTVSSIDLALAGEVKGANQLAVLA
jgi:hypothetical protein